MGERAEGEGEKREGEGGRGGRGQEETGGRREREKVIESVEKGEGRGRRMEEKGERRQAEKGCITDKIYMFK